jgi:hypothetical protein
MRNRREEVKQRLKGNSCFNCVKFDDEKKCSLKISKRLPKLRICSEYLNRESEIDKQMLETVGGEINEMIETMNKILHNKTKEMEAEIKNMIGSWNEKSRY